MHKVISTDRIYRTRVESQIFCDILFIGFFCFRLHLSYFKVENKIESKCLVTPQKNGNLANHFFNPKMNKNYHQHDNPQINGKYTPPPPPIKWKITPN